MRIQKKKSKIKQLYVIIARKYVNISVYCWLVTACCLETTPQTFKIYLASFLISSRTHKPHPNFSVQQAVIPPGNFRSLANSLASCISPLFRHYYSRERKYYFKRQKDIYDQKSVLNSYATGYLVWCLDEARQGGICTKLQPAYRGSFLVPNKLSAWCYTLADKNGKSRVVNHDKLELYLGDNPPRWISLAKKKLPAS